MAVKWHRPHRWDPGSRHTFHEGLEVAGKFCLQLVHAIVVLEGAHMCAHSLLHPLRPRTVYLPLGQIQDLACAQPTSALLAAALL